MSQELHYSYEYASSSGSSSPTDIQYAPLAEYQNMSYSDDPPSYSTTTSNTTQYSPPPLHPLSFPPPMAASLQLHRANQYTTPTQYPISNQPHDEYLSTDQRPMHKGHMGYNQDTATPHNVHNNHPRPRPHSRDPTHRVDVTHPYVRIYAKKEEKRRKIWNHALEKSLFNPYEL
jgi:hypothetical protein